MKCFEFITRMALLCPPILLNFIMTEMIIIEPRHETTFLQDLRNVSLHWQRLYNKYQTCRDIVSFT